MKVLITGAQGMVGSRLSKYLTKHQYDVTEFQGDIREWKDWSKYLDTKYDFLIHLAGLAGVRPSFEDPEKYYDHNVNGTACALRFGQIACDKVLYASSSNAYEWWGNPYAATKKMCEVLAEGKRAIGMRFHTVWPGRPDMLFRKLENNQVTYINTNHYRDFININDLLSAIELLMDNYNKVILTNSVVDIGTGFATPVEQVANMFGFDGEWHSTNPVGERKHTKANIEWLLQLGWTPRYNILIKDHHLDYE